tara:strand:- start:571 stop:1137 length:567 start_codon:yes stop_codon:yes gene_type:complete
MTKEKDFFYEASGLFLTEGLTVNEFDDILSKGDILPVCSDYEGWDSDYLEQKIQEVACELRSAYKRGADENDLYKSVDIFIKLCEKTRILHSSPNMKVEDSTFTILKDSNNTRIGNIYFTKNYEDFSVKVGEIEYASWTNSITLSKHGDEKEDFDSVISLLSDCISFIESGGNKRRTLNINEVLKTKE